MLCLAVLLPLLFLAESCFQGLAVPCYKLSQCWLTSHDLLNTQLHLHTPRLSLFSEKKRHKSKRLGYFARDLCLFRYFLCSRSVCWRAGGCVFVPLHMPLKDGCKQHCLSQINCRNCASCSGWDVQMKREYQGLLSAAFLLGSHLFECQYLCTAPSLRCSFNLCFLQILPLFHQKSTLLFLFLLLADQGAVLGAVTCMKQAK